MHILQWREYFKDYTESAAAVMGDDDEVLFQFFVLEDVGRPPGVKIPKWTCVAEGIYDVTISMSERFGREMMMLSNQDNQYEIIDPEGVSWKGLRVHGGVTVDHTQGCLLANKASNHNGTMYGKCDPAIMDLIRPALKAGRKVTWEIKRK